MVIFGVVCGDVGDTMPIVRPATAYEGWALNNWQHENATLHCEDNRPEDDGRPFENCVRREVAVAAVAVAARRGAGADADAVLLLQYSQ